MTWEVCQNPINKFKHHPAKVLVYAVLVFGMRHSILSLGSGVACNFRHVVSEKKCSSGRPSKSETILINFSTKLHPDPNYQKSQGSLFGSQVTWGRQPNALQRTLAMGPWAEHTVVMSRTCFCGTLNNARPTSDTRLLWLMNKCMGTTF